MYTVVQILTAARIVATPFIKGGITVQLTTGNQLIGTYGELLKFRDADRKYQGWEAHHIFEALDVERLGLESFAPPYLQQICVLLPAEGHHRINSILRRANPTRWSATAPELRAAYRDAYNLVGNYCGSSEALVSQELYTIFEAVLGNLVHQQNAAFDRARGELQTVQSKISAERAWHAELVKGSSPGVLQTAGFVASMMTPMTAAVALANPANRPVAGGFVNLLNPATRPDQSIWAKAEIYAQVAHQALLQRDLATATAAIALSRVYFEKADVRFRSWRDKIDLAGRRAELVIGVAAAVAILAAIGVYVVQGAGAGATAAATTGAGTQATAAETTEEGREVLNRVRVALDKIANADTLDAEETGEREFRQALRLGRR